MENVAEIKKTQAACARQSAIKSCWCRRRSKALKNTNGKKFATHMSIIITDTELIFKNPGSIGMAGKQADFSIFLNKIKVIGIKFMYLIDDDEYFIAFIDYAGKPYFLNSAFFDEQSFKKLQELFNLNFNIASFDDSYYKEGCSIIIYPKQYYGQPMFKKRKSFFESIMLFFDKLFFKKNPAWDYLSSESESIVASNT